ncbi:MAG: GIY-YIG catalytic domain protein [Candidatus Izimaplasma bacterium HR2]|nr:MAG: GIY-YIG catalytic domain protein [Candidatus Izimaplasma bacterium HR2]
MIGIYCFRNKTNGKRYIGQSINIEKRISNKHKYAFNNPKNCCYNTKFYQALRKYGLENFEIQILEECSIKELNEKEIY